MTDLSGKHRRMFGDITYFKGGKVPYILQLVVGCWMLGVIMPVENGDKSPYIYSSVAVGAFKPEACSL